MHLLKMVHAPLIAGAPAYPLIDVVLCCVVLCCVVLCCVVLCCAVVVVVSYVYNDKELRNDMDQDGSEAGWTHGKTTQVYHFLRSEERRVGKECRSRWPPYH